FILLISAAAAALLSAALAPLARRLAVFVGAVDHPGDRKIHSTPIPRFGGLAVMLSTVIVLAVLAKLNLLDAELRANHLLIGLAIGILPVLIVSIIDDIRPLPPLPKLFAQLCA